MEDKVVASLFLILIGAAIGMQFSPSKAAIDTAIKQCEQPLPRDQVCTWKVVAIPEVK